MTTPSTPPQAAAPGAPAATVAPATQAAAHARETRTMRLALHADADSTFPLFGPAREQEWSPGWAPRFVWPAAPGQGPEGAVFTTEGEGEDARLWVMTDYDPAARLVRYVILHPGTLVGELSIRVAPVGAGASTADVTYRFTALNAAGDDFVARWTAHFAGLKAHWEEALNARLGGPGGSHAAHQAHEARDTHASDDSHGAHP